MFGLGHLGLGESYHDEFSCLDGRSIPCADLRDRTRAGREPAGHEKIPHKTSRRRSTAPRAPHPQHAAGREPAPGATAQNPPGPFAGPEVVHNPQGQGPAGLQGPANGFAGPTEVPRAPHGPRAVPRAPHWPRAVPRTGQGRCPARAKGGALGAAAPRFPAARRGAESKTPHPPRAAPAHSGTSKPRTRIGGAGLPLCRISQCH